MAPVQTLVSASLPLSFKTAEAHFTQAYQGPLTESNNHIWTQNEKGQGAEREEQLALL